MASLVDRLERVTRRHVLRAMPPDAAGALEALSFAGLLIEYRVWRGRFVAPRPRAVHYTTELRGSSKAAEHHAALEAIAAKLRAGEDLTPHLSRRVSTAFTGDGDPKLTRRQDRDLLLADWGVHHLHLSTRLCSNGFVERTGDVLFAIFTDAGAYLTGIYDHPRHANWAAEEIFAVIVRNWPRAGLVHQARGVLGLSGRPSDEDRLRLRNSGAANIMEIDGKVYVPGGFGLTTAGTPLAATREVDKLMWELQGWRTDPYERLSAVEEVPPDAYWVPAIHVVEPGFEEYCGFRARDVFVPVGRLC